MLIALKALVVFALVVTLGLFVCRLAQAVTYKANTSFTFEVYFAAILSGLLVVLYSI